MGGQGALCLLLRVAEASGSWKLQLWSLFRPLSGLSGPLIRVSVETGGIYETTMHETWGDC